MAARKGNNYAKKLKTKELKIEAYKQYCDWISSGRPKKAWCFEHPNLTLLWETMEKYIREDKDFDPIHKKVAEAQRYDLWFQKAVDMIDGKIDKCQPAIYQMVMRNMFGWDKENTLQKESSQPLVKRITNAWRGLNE